MAGSLRPLFSSRLFCSLLRSPCTLCAPLTQAYGGRELSISASLSKDPKTPKKVGDKGPSKNYRRKMAKEAKTGNGGGVPQASGGREGGLDSLLMNMEHMETEEGSSVNTPDLMNVLSDVKVVKNKRETDKQRNFNAEELSSSEPNCQFLDPTAGPRLNLFNKPKPGVHVKPPGKPSYAEIDAREKLKYLKMLRPWSHFNDLVEQRDTPFPRQFPVDNEQYDQGEEADVSFEDHVLLDHHLKNFPKKGPVRHFMELVLTGLSKNPHYSASEKREIVTWYKQYFDNFTPEQLQAVNE